jgi:uncharacterized protein
MSAKLLRIFVLFMLMSGASGMQAQSVEAVNRENRPQSLPLTRLVILTGKLVPKRFLVQVARTPEQQETGLMWRKAMPHQEGMLFVFPTAKPATFWMRNTLLPLDLLFVRSDGTIANIAPNAKPKSLELLSSRGHVIAVLEIAGGRAKKLGVKAGDRVCHAELPPC